MEFDAEKDKITKNFYRFKFGNENIYGSLYLPKGANKVKITIELE